MKTLFALVAGICFVSFASGLHATVHFVNVNNSSPSSPYTDWASAATNIQDAIDVAVDGETILVTNGIYASGGRAVFGTMTNRVVINKAVMVQSINGPNSTVIAGLPGTGSYFSHGYRCVYMTNDAVLIGFTLTNGATRGGGTDVVKEQSGGAIWCESISATISNCVLVHSYANQNGGAAYRGTLNNCLITNDTAFANGGGTCNAILNNCIVSSNRTIQGLGGGGAAYGVLNNCLIARNYAFTGGGAFSNVLNNCVLQNNLSGTGGGAYGSVLINCTVVSNTASSWGGGVYGGTISNSIVFYNWAPKGSNYLEASGVVFNFSCTAPLATNGVGNITNPPAFVDWLGGDFHLQSNSPCVNAGNNSCVSTTTDLEGNPRIKGNTVDMGAFENQSVPTIHYVTINNMTPASPFTDWPTAATNIQDAIDIAVAGDLVLVSNGVYGVGGRAAYGTMTNRVTVNKPLTIQSVNGPDATAIEGLTIFLGGNTPRVRCVYLTNGAMLAGFTLTNGGTLSSGDVLREQSGGAVWCEGSDATISNCVLAANAAEWFGGGSFQGTLFNCLLTNNFAGRGGGACSNILIDCTLKDNLAGLLNLNLGGGALSCTLSNCLLAGNESWTFGGGAALSVLINCVLSNNLALNGGGLYLGTADHCLISSNRASQFGGGAYSNVMNDCIITLNRAATAGAGTYSSALFNCTVVSNTAGNGVTSGSGGGMFAGGATNCVVYYNAAEGGRNFSGSTMRFSDSFPLAPGLGNISNAPVFVDLAIGDIHLQSNSPCINSGNNSLVTSISDFDGNMRIAGGTVDMGAYEFQSPSSTVSYAYLQQYGLPTDGSADFLDSDGDGFTTSQEWHIGTNPTNSMSLLEMLTPTNTVSGATITWQSVTNILYFVERSSDLSAQPPFFTIQSNIVGQAGTTSYPDLSATNPIPYFYRIGVQ